MLFVEAIKYIQPSKTHSKQGGMFPLCAKSSDLVDLMMIGAGKHGSNVLYSFVAKVDLVS